MVRRLGFITAAALAALPYIASAQMCEPPKELAPVVASPSGTMFERIGSTDMPMTTKSEKCRALVKQGFALLHCYWFNESVRTFRDAVKEDPSCAMAWCGLNVALTQPWNIRDAFQQEAEYAIQRAVKMCGDCPPAEQDVIAAFRLRSFKTNDKDPDFLKAIRGVWDKHPELDEPRLIVAGIRVQGDLSAYEGGDVDQDKMTYSIIEPVLKRNPNSPGVMHYHIHAVESWNPQDALETARRLTRMNSSSGHLLHMPGHIYFTLGLYEEGRAAFQSAKESEEKYAAGLNTTPANATWNYTHNVDYLSVNLLEMGRVKEGTEIARRDKNLFRWRAGDWDNIPRPQDGKGTSVQFYAGGMASLKAGNLNDAIAYRDSLKGRAEKNQGDLTTQSMSNELDGAVLFAQGNVADGRLAYGKSIAAYDRIWFSEPPIHLKLPHESYAQNLIKAGYYEDAVKIIDEGLVKRKHSGWLIYWKAKAYEAEGKQAEAKAAYKEFQDAWKTADADRPELREAEQFMAAHQD